MVFFYEWKEAVLHETGERQSFFKLERCSRGYVPIFLTYLFIISVILCLGFIRALVVELFLTVITVFILVTLIIHRPYNDCIHNVAIIYNISILSVFMGGNLARNFFPILNVEQNEATAILAIIGAVTVCLIIATARVIYHLRSLFIRGFCF